VIIYTVVLILLICIIAFQAWQIHQISTTVVLLDSLLYKLIHFTNAFEALGIPVCQECADAELAKGREEVDVTHIH
jgi:hypothetical protein